MDLNAVDVFGEDVKLVMVDELDVEDGARAGDIEVKRRWRF